MSARRHLALALVVLVGCHAHGPMTPPAAAGRGTEARNRAASAPSDPELRELARIVNRRRADLGCRPLVWDERLAAVALRHSEDMARRHFFAHTNPDGEDPFERLRDAGVVYCAAAENLAEGPMDPETVLDGWLHSRAHRRNLDDCKFTHHGVGLFRNHWTHVFVRYAAAPR